MALLDNRGGIAPPPLDVLSGELVDAISEALASPADAPARALAICSVIQEMYETVEWVDASSADGDELASLGGLVSAAADHLARMGGSVHAARVGA